MKCSTQLTIHFPQESPQSCPVYLENNLLKNIALWLPDTDRNLVIITDEIVGNLYGFSFKESLEQAGYKPILLTFPAGEQHKNSQTKSFLEAGLFAQSCGRDTLILALGGGVVGDLAGFVAATYMRGIPYIQIPTTLLAMVDSAIGGKTGIDTPQGKNLIGAFWQPQAIVSDLTVLTTLSNAQWINGLMEIVKIFLTSDPDSLAFLQTHLQAILNRDPVIVQALITKAVQLKIAIIMRDTHETHERMVLNFGHTIGHALELLTDYQLLHGYAVAYGMLVESKIACLSGYLTEDHYQAIEELLQHFGIHREVLLHFDADAVIQATLLDKKKKRHAVRYVLLQQPGKVVVTDNQWVFEVSDVLVKQALESFNNQEQ